VACLYEGREIKIRSRRRGSTSSLCRGTLPPCITPRFIQTQQQRQGLFIAPEEPISPTHSWVTLPFRARGEPFGQSISFTFVIKRLSRPDTIQLWCGSRVKKKKKTISSGRMREKTCRVKSPCSSVNCKCKKLNRDSWTRGARVAPLRAWDLHWLKIGAGTTKNNLYQRAILESEGESLQKFGLSKLRKK